VATVAHATNQNSVEQYRDAARPSQAPNSAKPMRVAGRPPSMASAAEANSELASAPHCRKSYYVVNLMTGNSKTRSTYCVNTFSVEW